MGIGPSTKETTLHHFRDPLLNVITKDKDVDLLGVIIVGTPQDNKDKHFVGERAAQWVESMQVDGVIISADGWGNSDVDFANTIEEIGQKNIPVVGLSFIGKQGKFVVTNKYMDTIVDFNKSKKGIETEVVGENNIDKIDAKKSLALLKLKMMRK
ncbi:glycine/sarcosine/betaine reductase component B subunit [Clostridiisalibacter paucivorans]|uniref:glycine/sarcosine/betaine reductase component B subunit n=1 Tax=Clostridiisalibacter paucivorans TaxID=408753 RepID=UPI00047E19E2|nr:glycine/sarcosine/betaine reductase component B subunit [Clostridiisalibacter paucivorans]